MKLQAYNRCLAKNTAIVPLRELLPLAIPLSMLIEPTNRCNFRCQFCPTGNDELLKQVGRPKGSMSYELYIKIIDDLRSLCDTAAAKLKRLHLYKDGEPLLHPDLGKMIAYAKERDVSESIETTTNGALLTKIKAFELIHSGLDVIRVSIEHTTDAGYKAITRTFGDYRRIIQNVEGLFQEKERQNSALQIHAKIVDAGLSDAEKERFIADFSPISDSLNIDQLMGWSKSEVMDWKLGQSVTTGMDGVTALKEWDVCPDPFSKLAINFNGTASICCVDWSHGTVVGDLTTQSLTEVWEGEALRHFRRLHLTGQRKQIEACSSCDYLKTFPEYARLDDDTERLLRIY